VRVRLVLRTSGGGFGRAGFFEVNLAGLVTVRTSAAIEVVPLAVEGIGKIVAIPAAEHLLVLAQRVGVDTMSDTHGFVTRPAVQDIAARSPPEYVVALVLAAPTVGVVLLVGAEE
jgi:hypothetical protein